MDSAVSTAPLHYHGAECWSQPDLAGIYCCLRQSVYFALRGRRTCLPSHQDTRQASLQLAAETNV